MRQRLLPDLPPLAQFYGITPSDIDGEPGMTPREIQAFIDFINETAEG